MASTSNCLKTAPDQAGDLSSLVLKGKVDEDVLKDYAKDGQIDSPDKEGKTPLMIACLHGLTDTVKSLLANGADPNSKNFKDGNTPLHYACMVVEPLEEDSLFGRYYSPSKWMTAKLAITVLLVSHEAETVQDNYDGWSPVCVASLYLLTDVVDFLLSQDTTSLETKIKAMEILGVSQAMSDNRYKFQDSIHSFSKAMQFRQNSGLSEPQRETSELAECFSNISFKECNTLQEIESNQASVMAMKGHAFIIGNRLFPNSLKHKYLYTSLTAFASSLMFDRTTCDEGFQILSCALKFENRGELKLGSVASQFANKSEAFSFDEEPDSPFHLCARKLLCSYKYILTSVPTDSLLDDTKTLIESFGKILFHYAFNFSNMEVLKSILQAIEKSMRVIQARILTKNPKKYLDTPSVTLTIMQLLGESYVDNMYCGMSSRCLLRVKFVIFKILSFDNASYKDTNGCNLLHLVTYCAQTARDIDYLVDLARLFVRHGCPIDVVNNDGETARYILEELAMGIGEADAHFLTLVSPPTMVLRLEELAMRTILRHHINYRDKLPPSLCEMLEDGVEESEIERASTDSDMGSEDGN
ncbi:uncharacterized protein LOC121427501 [Lytechinus variegatus]|uniref:uncharacterized protein LOC121427501 n=1 Tax=Lytechinus variegatus TaxID=7654 RepID=UPI001BB142A0|nr:uncharacterized protein LOC121427501 [Lytechinus variegatus]XP_041479861.1 uncharacterized protein LOC121427501 [Lytechinus variegatus]XP_041479863.1 uncharacterized protein LOC121427501 [Lytechinus variegatus]